MRLKTSLVGLSASVAIGALTLIAAMGPASARMVCNSDGDCWHTDNNHAKYSNDIHVQTHPDDWYFHQKWDSDKEHHYRDYHEGKGYYRGGAWVTE